MATPLPVPPSSVPVIDPRTGQMDIQWRNYYQSLNDALGTAGAPDDAQYWVSETNSALTNERNFGVLATGYVFNTSAAGVGVPSIKTSIPSGDVTGAALTKTDDTNVTLTLGGTPATGLLKAISLTLGWLGQLAVGRGGTGRASHTEYAVICGGTTTTAAQQSIASVGTAGQVLTSNGAGALPTFQAASGGGTSGTYTPTLTNVANISARTAYACQYMRVGSVVTVSGRIDIDPSAGSTDTQIGMSLPVASNFTLAEQCGGVLVSNAVYGACGNIYADTTNDRANLRFISTAAAANDAWFFTFTYQVL